MGKGDTGLAGERYRAAIDPAARSHREIGADRDGVGGQQHRRPGGRQVGAGDGTPLRGELDGAAAQAGEADIAGGHRLDRGGGIGGTDRDRAAGQVDAERGAAAGQLQRTLVVDRQAARRRDRILDEQRPGRRQRHFTPHDVQRAGHGDVGIDREGAAGGEGRTLGGGEGMAAQHSLAGG